MSVRILWVLMVASLVAGSPVLRAADNYKVTILQPKKGAMLSGKKEIILVKFQQGKYAIKSLSFLMDQSEVTTDRGPFKESEEISFNFDTTAFTDGKHRLAVKVVDTKDNPRTDEIEIEIRNKQP